MTGLDITDSDKVAFHRVLAHLEACGQAGRRGLCDYCKDIKGWWVYR